MHTNLQKLRCTMLQQMKRKHCVLIILVKLNVLVVKTLTEKIGIIERRRLCWTLLRIKFKADNDEAEGY